jgi:hypothetical protein
MKIKELNPEIVEFKPFELVLSIESKRELEMLWLIFNASPTEMAIFLNNIDRSSYPILKFTTNEICQNQNRSLIWKFFEEKIKQQLIP